MCKSIRKTKNHPDADLLEILEKPLIIRNKWTEKEKNAFVKATRKHGKNYEMIQKRVATRTRK